MKDGGGQLPRFGRWRNQVRHHVDRHSGGTRGCDSSGGIFEHQTIRGICVEPAGGEKEQVRRWLSVDNFFACGDRVETVQQTGGFELGERGIARGRSRDSHRDMARFQHFEQPIEPGFFWQGCRFERDSFEPFASFAKSIPREGRAEVFLNDLLAFDSGAPDDTTIDGLGQFIAALGGRFDPCFAIPRFGVEHQSVHIEDHGKPND
jgi:hypothetical protein